MSVGENVLITLLKYLESTFSSSGPDRGALHKVEWNAGSGAPSVLGEVEVRADNVVGISMRCLGNVPCNVNELIDFLKKESIYQSETLLEWISKNGDDYHGFLCYIAAVENLRVGTLAFLESNCSLTKTN